MRAWPPRRTRERARPTRVRVAHSVALCVAIAALALALREAAAFFLVLALLAAGALATPFAEWTSVPPRLARALPRVLGLTLLVIAGVAWLSRALGVLVLEPTFVPMMAAPFLVPMAAVFALAPRTFPTGRTLLPTVIFLLGLAGLDPSPAGYGPSMLPFLRGGDHNAFSELYLVLALVVLGALWTAALLESGPRWRVRDAIGLAVVGALAAALAATGIVGLPLLQPRIERALAEALDQGQSGLSGESTLGEFAEWPCRAAASSTCERLTPRPAPGSFAPRCSPPSTGATGAIRPAWPGPPSPGPGPRPFSNPASPRLESALSSPTSAPVSRAAARGQLRSTSSSTSRTWDAGPSSCRAA